MPHLHGHPRRNGQDYSQMRSQRVPRLLPATDDESRGIKEDHRMRMSYVQGQLYRVVDSITINVTVNN